MFKICGESSQVQGETVISWKEQQSEIVQGYSKPNIWNLNEETGLFFRALPNRGFAKERDKVVALGYKKKTVFIWKPENPRCLWGFVKSCLPVSYYIQSKAWMSGEILEDILTTLKVQPKYSFADELCQLSP